MTTINEKVRAAINSQNPEAEFKSMHACIRADRGMTDIHKGRRLTYIRKIMREAQAPQELIDLMKDTKLTRAANMASEKTLVAQGSARVIPRDFTEEALMRVHAKFMADWRAFEDWPKREQQYAIRAIVCAGALRRIEFSTINVFMRNGAWVANNIAKADPDIERPFLCLWPVSDWLLMLREARGLIQCDQGVYLFDPATPREAYDFRRQYPGYTYKDLRAIGASLIAARDGRSLREREAITDAALRHSQQPISLAARYGAFAV